jgi:hypothetical protein
MYFSLVRLEQIPSNPLSMILPPLIPPSRPLVSLLITLGTNETAFLRYRQTDRVDKLTLMLTEAAKLRQGGGGLGEVGAQLVDLR